MTHESEEAKGTFGVIRSPRARAARYREHAAHFARLAEAEPVERIPRSVERPGA